jgi:hypothetical protein
MNVTFEEHFVVPKAQMAGTKHSCAVFETPKVLPSYLQGRGTLHG